MEWTASSNHVSLLYLLVPNKPSMTQGLMRYNKTAPLATIVGLRHQTVPEQLSQIMPDRTLVRIFYSGNIPQQHNS